MAFIDTPLLCGQFIKFVMVRLMQRCLQGYYSCIDQYSPYRGQVPSLKINPCLTCGACCARFRVSSLSSEVDDQEGGVVPVAFTKKINPTRSAMKGTTGFFKRCAALEGIIGQGVSCAIYQERPSTGRFFLQPGKTPAAMPPATGPGQATDCSRSITTRALPGKDGRPGREWPVHAHADDNILTSSVGMPIDVAMWWGKR